MTIKFLHKPLEEIDQLCREAERSGEKVMILVHTYKKERNVNPNSDYYDGSSTEEDEDALTGGFGQQIHSSKDVIQFDNEDMKFLSKEDIEELL